MNIPNRFLQYNILLLHTIKNKWPWFFTLYIISSILPTISGDLVRLFSAILIPSISVIIVAYIVLYAEQHRNLSHEISLLWQFIKKKFIPVLCIQVVLYIAFSIGLMALIVPGLIIAFFCSYSYLFVLLKNSPIFRSLHDSFCFVKKIWLMQIMLYSLYLIAPLIALLVLIPMVFISPSYTVVLWFINSFVLLYTIALQTIIFVDNAL